MKQHLVVIGVDVGTQGTKATLYTVEGTLLSEGFVASKLHQPKPGIVEEDPEDQVEAVCGAVRQCMDRWGGNPASVQALAIDGQMAGIIGVGRDGRNITPYDSWLDTRCSPYIEVMNREAGSEIIQKTGGSASFNHGPKKLWWMHRHSETFSKIAAFVQPGAYAAMRLCGLSGDESFMDWTYLHFSGFADNRNSRWDDELCTRFRFPKKKLPRILSPFHKVGTITKSAAEKCGLTDGVGVMAGCGDTAASFLSCGAVKKGVCVDVAGTASVFAATTDKFRSDESNRVLGCSQSVVPGLWHPYAYINGGGMNLEWFKKEIANRGLEQGDENRYIDFEFLNLEATKIENPEDIPFFVPHFAGRVTPSMPYLRGAWVGLDWSHSLPHLYCAVLEGVVLEYGIYRNVIRGLYPDFSIDEIRITGGGEKSRLWNRMKADVMETPVVTIVGSGGAPMGSAMVAAVGAGLFSDCREIAEQWIETEEPVMPDPNKAVVYRNKVKRYGKLITVLNRFHQNGD